MRAKRLKRWRRTAFALNVARVSASRWSREDSPRRSGEEHTRARSTVRALVIADGKRNRAMKRLGASHDRRTRTRAERSRVSLERASLNVTVNESSPARVTSRPHDDEKNMISSS